MSSDNTKFIEILATYRWYKLKYTDEGRVAVEVGELIRQEITESIR